jgi:hypothetical protein
MVLPIPQHPLRQRLDPFMLELTFTATVDQGEPLRMQDDAAWAVLFVPFVQYFL